MNGERKRREGSSEWLTNTKTVTFGESLGKFTVIVGEIFIINETEMSF